MEQGKVYVANDRVRAVKWTAKNSSHVKDVVCRGCAFQDRPCRLSDVTGWDSLIDAAAKEYSYLVCAEGSFESVDPLELEIALMDQGVGNGCKS